MPSFVRTDDSGEGGGAFCLGLLTLEESGRGLTGGDEAGSIFQGETLSGRGIVEGSSQRTYSKKKTSSISIRVKIIMAIVTIKQAVTFKYLQLESGHSGSRFSQPTIVPVNLRDKDISHKSYFE